MTMAAASGKHQTGVEFPSAAQLDNLAVPTFETAPVTWLTKVSEVSKAMALTIPAQAWTRLMGPNEAWETSGESLWKTL